VESLLGVPIISTCKWNEVQNLGQSLTYYVHERSGQNENRWNGIQNLGQALTASGHEGSRENENSYEIL